jgi:Cu2+-containing amine oxidase
LQGNQENGVHPAPALPPFELSADEVRTARDLAELGIAQAPHPDSLHDRTYFTKVELLPDSQAQTKQRLVLVTHYRYRGDEAILSMVDLNRHEVVKVETVPHLPTPLAPEEVARAQQLARTDPQLAEVFNTQGLKVEAKVLYVPQHDPLFGHRVVALLFSTGGNYLRGPEVLVDLTPETLRIDANSLIQQAN